MRAPEELKGAAAGAQGRGVGHQVALARREATAVPVTVDVVVSDRALLGHTADPGPLRGYGPVPVSMVRELAPSAEGAGLAALRRLYATPTRLVAMDSTSQTFPRGLTRLIRLRDQAFRTPWCDSPIRHTDHALPRAEKGPTTAGNGQGLCEACNYAKQAPDGRARPRAGATHTIQTTTPTGDIYHSHAPPPPSPAPMPTRAEIHFTGLVLSA